MAPLRDVSRPVLPCGITIQGETLPRTSLLIRLSQEDASRIHRESSSEYRSLSGYLLRVLQRSFRIEDAVSQQVRALWSMQDARRQAEVRARATIGPQNKKLHTAVHLRCTVEEAAKIRKYAARRHLSISDFVIFSLRRLWQTLEQAPYSRRRLRSLRLT